MNPVCSGGGPASRYASVLAYAVVHASAVYTFLTFAIATDGLQFFYFYPREAQTILSPYTLHELIWFAAAAFLILGLIILSLRDGRTQDTRPRRNGTVVLAGIVIAVAVVGGLAVPYPALYWLIGTAAVVVSWLGLQSGIVRMIGSRRQVLESFFVSLLGIGAIVEIWSLIHWVYSGFVPLAGYEKAWPDLETNLSYAGSSLFPVMFVALWLSPIWAFVVVKLYQRASPHKSADSKVSCDQRSQRLKIGLDDFILVLVLILICVMIGFYPYFHEPSWLVGTDAYWRYKDPLDRVTTSPNVLSAASNERHGLYLLILYGIGYVTGLSPFDVVRASPMLLASLLAILTYLVVARLRDDRTEGFLAAFLSATTFPTTLGIFASIDANWFAMAFAVAALFLLVSLGESSREGLWKVLLVALCGIALLLLHPWAWGIIALSTLVAGLVFLTKRNWRMFAASLTVLISGLVSAAVVLIAGSDAERARLLETVGTYTAPLNELSLIQQPFEVIYSAMRIWSPFLNPLLVILAVAGVVLLLVRCESASYKIFVLSWMIVSGVGTFLGVTLETEIWRIWYLQPLWLLGAIGIRGFLQRGNLTSDQLVSSRLTARIVLILGLAGVAVFLLEPVVGGIVFYGALIALILLHVGGRRENTKSLLEIIFVIFILAFFLNHALRSLYPLVLNPHNYRP